jgi:hypothetical protein
MALVEASMTLGFSLEVALDLHHPRLDTLHDGQRDRNVLARLDVREPVLTSGGKLDLLEQLSAPALLRTSRAPSLTTPVRACARVARDFR